jgi:hypothetical protein
MNIATAHQAAVWLPTKIKGAIINSAPMTAVAIGRSKLDVQSLYEPITPTNHLKFASFATTAIANVEPTTILDMIRRSLNIVSRSTTPHAESAADIYATRTARVQVACIAAETTTRIAADFISSANYIARANEILDSNKTSQALAYF